MALAVVRRLMESDHKVSHKVQGRKRSRSKSEVVRRVTSGQGFQKSVRVSCLARQPFLQSPKGVLHTTFNTSHSLMLGVPYYYYYYYFCPLVVFSERKGNLKRSSEKSAVMDPGRSRFQLTCVTTTTKCVSENVVGERSWVLSNIQRGGGCGQSSQLHSTTEQSQCQDTQSFFLQFESKQSHNWSKSHQFGRSDSF